MRLLNHEDIWDVYSMDQALDDVADAFVAVAHGATDTPLRTRITPDDERAFLIMPAYASEVDALAVKTIAIVPGNAERGLPTAPASVLLVDGETGQTRALLDGDTVTRIRTGASSGVAFRHLARSSSEVGLLVGTGSQALTQALAMIAAVPTLAELRVANPIPGEADAFLTRLREHRAFADSGFDGVLVATEDAEAGAEGADIITLVTSSTDPVLGAAHLTPGATVSCVGSYQPHMEECGPDIMAAAAAIFCDDVDACLAESGDLIKPLDDGTITRDKIRGAIGDVISGALPGRQSDDDVLVYETVGVGAQDLWAAARIVDAAERVGVGTEWN